MIVDIEFDKAASVRAAIAVEFLPNKIRLMQLEDRGKSSIIRSFAEIPLASEEIKDGIIQNPKLVGQKLAEVLSKTSPKRPNTTYVICIIPQPHTFLTVLDLPAVDKEELKDIIIRKVGEIIPMDEGQVYWDWHRINSTQNRTRVQLAAVARELIDSYMQTLDEAKLIPLLFEPAAAAAGRVVMPGESAELQKKSTQPVVIMELQENLGVVSLHQAGGIVFSTDISLRTDSIAQKVIVIEQKVAELVKYANSHLGIVVKDEELKVFVYGDNQVISKLIPLIQERTQYQISLIQAKFESPEVIQFIKNKNDGGIYSLLGAAIRGKENYSDEATLNLIPQKAKEAFRRKEMYNVMRDYLMFAAINSVFLVFMLIVVAIQIKASETNLRSQYDSILAISNSQTVNTVEGQVAALNAQTAELNGLIGGLYDWQEFLSLLNRTTPQKVAISNATVAPYLDLNTGGRDRWKVSIAGSASDRESIIEFVNRLRSDGLLEKVKLPIQSLEDEFNSNFIIEAELPFVKLDRNED